MGASKQLQAFFFLNQGIMLPIVHCSHKKITKWSKVFQLSDDNTIVMTNEEAADGPSHLPLQNPRGVLQFAGAAGRRRRPVGELITHESSGKADARYFFQVSQHEGK